MGKKSLVLVLLVPFLIFLILIFLKPGGKDKMNSDDVTQGLTTSDLPADISTEDSEEENSAQSPESNIDPDRKYYAVLDTAKGEIKIELNTSQTPATAGNFITLSKKGFYNGLNFHRTISGFMIQGGCPNGDGTGGPGYAFNDELFEGEYLRGTVAMANSGPNTNGSQFFIMHQDYPLPKNYVIFGRVVEGIEIVDLIAEAPTLPNDFGENSKPVTPVSISSVEIVGE